MKGCGSKKKMMKGGKTKSSCGTKKMSGGGMCRGYGAATRGMKTSSKMG